MKRKSVLDLIDELREIIDLITDEFITPSSLKENSTQKLSQLLKLSLEIIENIGNSFEDFLKIDVNKSNEKIDFLIKSLSIMFYNKNNSKENFSKEEKQLYQDLLGNLHILSKKSIEFENKYHLDLHTFDKASVSEGLKYMQEGFNIFWDDFLNHRGEK